MKRSILADWTAFSEWVRLQREMDKFDQIHGIGKFKKKKNKKGNDGREIQGN